SCAEELDWLRLERELMAQRAQNGAALPNRIWQGIEQRVAGQGRVRKSRSVVRGFSVAVAAAAAVLVVVPQVQRHLGAMVSHKVAPKAQKRPEVALQRAEQQYKQAIAMLELDYASAKRRLPPDEAARLEKAFVKVRAKIGQGRN